MLSLEEARQRILDGLPPPQTESVAIGEAAGRVLNERAVAATPLPPFDNSAMDGYAVRAADVAGATAERPARLRIIGLAPAGTVFNGEITPGTCVRLFTGSPLPRGADAVVMQEDTRRDESAGHVLVLDKVCPWENVRLRGEDAKEGAVVAEAGTRLNTAQLALLAASGVAAVKAGRRPGIGLLATGDELREPGQPLKPGQIYESNRLAVAALLASIGAIPRSYPLVPDTLEATCDALNRALAECDAVVTTGGASVGEMDFLKAAWERLGGKLDFWKVAIKPGKPFVFGTLHGKALFGLPGNPVSAFVTFLLLVRPAVLRLQGAAEVSLPSHHGALAEPLVNRGDRRHFMRVRVDASGKVWPAGLQASHALNSLAAANGLVDVPPETTLPADAAVNVLRWE